MEESAADGQDGRATASVTVEKEPKPAKVTPSSILRPGSMGMGPTKIRPVVTGMPGSPLYGIVLIKMWPGQCY